MSQEIQEGLENTDSEVVDTPTDSTSDDTASFETTSTETTSNLSPAWAGFLETIPSEFVPKATPILEQWDKDFQEVQLANSKYKPYEEFISHDPETLRGAMQIMNMIENDPRSIFDRIGEHHGYLNNEAGQGDEEEFDEDEFDPDAEDHVDLESNPAFQQMQEQNQFLQQYVEQQEAVKMEAAADDFIKSQFDEIKTLHGGELSADEKSILSDLAIASMNTSGELNLVKAYNEKFSKFVSHARNTSANKTVTPVLSGSGGVPVTPKSYGSKDFENSLEDKLKALGLGN